MAVVLGSGLVAAVAGEGPRLVAGLDETVAALGVRGLRPTSRATRLASVAAAEALGHPSPPPGRPERRAVTLGTRFASIEPLVEFLRSAAVDGPRLVNPSSFPNVVVNAHAGYLAILFGLAGPNITLCGEDAGLDALDQALDLLELGRADLVLAGGVEALGPTLAAGLQRSGVGAPAEAAAFLVLAPEGDGVHLERARAGDRPEREWSAADALPGSGAAGGAVAAVLAVRAAAAGCGPQGITGERVVLLAEERRAP